MNLFKKYGIKEIADVTFYSILKTGNQEFYIPVLFLDTLKVSTLTQKTSDVSASGGYANQKIFSWNFGKNATLKLEDALFSSASQSLMSGWLSGKVSKYISILRKISVANQYGELHYSTFAYPSPELDENEWELIFKLIGNPNSEQSSANRHLWKNYNFEFLTYQIVPITKEFIDQPYVGEIRKKLKEYYKKRLYNPAGTDKYIGFDTNIYSIILDNLKTIDDYYKIDSNNYKLNIIDRMESGYAPESGLKIDFQKQKDNLQKYFQNNKSESYSIYFDPRTMSPLVNNFIDGTFDIDSNSYFLRAGTHYYKWSRTVQRILSDKDFLGKALVINADNFPGVFKIVGETYIREQQTQKDIKYQFVINRAQLSPDTNINLSAAGEPTTFSMNINILPCENGNMIELREFNTVDDLSSGGTKIVAQTSEYTKTYVAKETQKYNDIIVEEE